MNGSTSHTAPAFTDCGETGSYFMDKCFLRCPPAALSQLCDLWSFLNATSNCYVLQLQSQLTLHRAEQSQGALMFTLLTWLLCPTGRRRFLALGPASSTSVNMKMTSESKEMLRYNIKTFKVSLYLVCRSVHHQHLVIWLVKFAQ